MTLGGCGITFAFQKMNAAEKKKQTKNQVANRKSQNSKTRNVPRRPRYKYKASEGCVDEEEMYSERE